MSECDECRAARETEGHHRRFDSLKCVYCAARLIQVIQRLRVAESEVRDRCRAVVAESAARGLDEQLIRKIAKAPGMAVAPVQPQEKKGKKK